MQRPCDEERVMMDDIHFIQVIPSGKYQISVVESDMKNLTGKRAYNTVNIGFYYID